MNTYRVGGGCTNVYTTSKRQRFMLTRAAKKKKARNDFWKRFKETHPAKDKAND